MILLIAPSQCAQECADAIRRTGETVREEESVARAIGLLRAESYAAVVLDQSLIETVPYEVDTVMSHSGTAVIVPVNLALCGRDRLVREVRAALKRKGREEAAVREAALGELQCELRQTITGMMLSVDLALQATPPEAADRLQTIRGLVDVLCRQVQRHTGTEEREGRSEI